MYIGSSTCSTPVVLRASDAGKDQCVLGRGAGNTGELLVVASGTELRDVDTWDGIDEQTKAVLTKRLLESVGGGCVGGVAAYGVLGRGGRKQSREGGATSVGGAFTGDLKDDSTLRNPGRFCEVARATKGLPLD